MIAATASSIAAISPVSALVTAVAAGVCALGFGRGRASSLPIVADPLCRDDVPPLRIRSIVARVGRWPCNGCAFGPFDAVHPLSDGAAVRASRCGPFTLTLPLHMADMSGQVLLGSCLRLWGRSSAWSSSWDSPSAASWCAASPSRSSPFVSSAPWGLLPISSSRLERGERLVVAPSARISSRHLWSRKSRGSILSSLRCRLWKSLRHRDHRLSQDVRPPSRRFLA